MVKVLGRHYGLPKKPWLVLILKRHVGHIVHIGLFTHKIGAKKGDTKRGKKNEQRSNAEPLDAIDGLQKVFVHKNLYFKAYRLALILLERGANRFP